MRFPSTIVALLLLVAGASARAQPVEGGGATVQRKLFTMSNRWETGIAFATSLNTSLVDQNGVLASVSYHPNEWADVGVDALVNSTRLSGLAQQVRANLPQRTTNAGAPLVRDEIARADQLRGALLGTARIAPIYGKLNIASELTLHFQAFVLGGGGAAQVRHESINLCAVGGTAPCPSGGYQTSESFKPVAQIGGGMRFYFGQRMSVRAELRAFFHPASYVRGADLTAPGSGSDHRYLAVTPTLALGASALF